jgi:hypothetical protein
MNYMFETFEEWYEMLGGSKNHPDYERFKTIWNLARLLKPKEEE